jgi:hypothetical protein
MLSSQDPERFARILRLLKEGQHEVGIHGFDCDISSNLVRRVLGLAETKDLTKIQQNFSNLLDQRPTLYRPHGFQLGRQLYEAIKASGLKLIVGSPIYQIGQRNPARSYLNGFEKAEPGDIICGHDSKDCSPDFGLAWQIAQIVPKIERIVARRNLSVVTISEILRPVSMARNDFFGHLQRNALMGATLNKPLESAISERRAEYCSNPRPPPFTSRVINQAFVQW